MSRRDDLEKLNIEHQRRLQKLEEQRARYGISVEPKILLEIEDIKAELVKLQAELDALPDIIQQNPFRGLSAFGEEDVAVFFGRETITGQLIERVQQKTLVAVLGPSGSGKSSLVMAGLIPGLRCDGHQWLITYFRLGSDPFHALAAALLPLYEIALDKTDQMAKIPKLATYLRQGDLALGDVVVNIFEAQPRAKRVLLLADQFEELYTLVPDTETRHRFLDLLLPALNADSTSTSSPSRSLNLVLTLRADFLGQALLYVPFADALQDSIELLRPMSLNELRMAVEKPATVQGVTFEPGLVESILKDVKNEPGNLPLLEFALTQLWEHQEQGQLTHAAYEAIGRVEGALSRHAEQVFAGLGEIEQTQARRVFVQMVRPGEGTEDTGRLTTKAELGETSWNLVRHLADGRLVVTNRDKSGQETVELAHEALIREWQQLREWIEEDRVTLRIHRRLAEAVNEWKRNNGDGSYLYQGLRLAEVEDWPETRTDFLSTREHQFLEDSLKYRDTLRRVKLQNKVWSIVGSGALGGGLGSALGRLISFIFDGIPGPGVASSILGSLIPGTLFGTTIALGIGLGLIYGGQKKVLPMVGGTLAAIPIGILEGLILSEPLLGGLSGAVYGFSIALSFVIGNRFGRIGRLLIWGAMAVLVGLITFESLLFYTPFSGIFAAIAIIAIITMVDYRSEKAATAY